MKSSSLQAKLDAILHNYNYGIVAGSATVFTRDETNGIGHLDLTLLEQVLVVIEVSLLGYKVCSSSPLASTEISLVTATTVNARVNILFDTMESLLMAISPMFCQQFEQVYKLPPYTAASSAENTMNPALLQDTLEDINHWIH